MSTRICNENGCNKQPSYNYKGESLDQPVICWVVMVFRMNIM